MRVLHFPRRRAGAQAGLGVVAGLAEVRVERRHRGWADLQSHTRQIYVTIVRGSMVEVMDADRNEG